MNFKAATFLMSLVAVAAVSAGEAEEQARFQKYKEAVKQDPALIRMYTFEEGQGNEIANQVLLDPVLTAVTGGPRANGC